MRIQNCYPLGHTPSFHCWYTWSPHFRGPENLLLVSDSRCFLTFSLEAPESGTRAHLPSPTLKQAYAHSPSLRRASESYPLSPTLCLTRTDFPPGPAQLRAGRDPRPAGASAWPFHVSTSSTDFRVADFHAARENSSHTRDGRQPGAGGLLAAGTLNTWMFSSKPPHSGPAPLRTPLAGVAVVAMSLEAFRR